MQKSKTASWYLLSVVATFLPQVTGSVTFYDTTALIITLIFPGKFLEAVLLRFHPDRVSLQEIEVALDDIGYTVAK